MGETPAPVPPVPPEPPVVPPGPPVQPGPPTAEPTEPPPSVPPVVEYLVEEDNPTWKPLLEQEDLADLLTGEDQEDAYGRLIAQVKALEENSDVLARRERILSRLQKKQHFANQRRTAETAAEKSDVVQAAFNIGNLHLEDNDPRRALNWVKIISTYDPQSSEAGNLANRVVTWFHDKIQAHVDAGQYFEVEKEFKRWRSLRPDPKNPETCLDEAMIQELVTAYAKSVREVTVAPYLKQELAKAEKEPGSVENGGMTFPLVPDPEYTVADIAKQLLDFWRSERKGETWDEIDIDITSALTKRIKQAKAEQTKQSAMDMQVVIDAYDRLYRRNQATVEFRQQLGELRQLLKDRDEPLKDDRAGVVKGALIRFEALIGQGPVTSRSGNERARQSSVLIPMLDVQFNAWKARESLMFFTAFGQMNTDFGFGVQSHLFSVNDKNSSLSLIQAHLGFDIRINGETWTLGTRMGPMFLSSKFTGLDNTIEQSDISVISFSFKGEKGFKMWNRWFSLYGEFQLTNFDKYIWNKFSLSGRWYIMNNLGIGLGYETLNLNQFGTGDTPKIHTYFGVPTFELIFQF